MPFEDEQNAKSGAANLHRSQCGKTSKSCARLQDVVLTLFHGTTVLILILCAVEVHGCLDSMFCGLVSFFCWEEAEAGADA